MDWGGHSHRCRHWRQRIKVLFPQGTRHPSAVVPPVSLPTPFSIIKFYCKEKYNFYIDRILLTHTFAVVQVRAERPTGGAPGSANHQLYCCAKQKHVPNPTVQYLYCSSTYTHKARLSYKRGLCLLCCGVVGWCTLFGAGRSKKLVVACTPKCLLCPRRRRQLKLLVTWTVVHWVYIALQLKLNRYRSVRRRPSSVFGGGVGGGVCLSVALHNHQQQSFITSPPL